MKSGSCRLWDCGLETLLDISQCAIVWVAGLEEKMRELWNGFINFAVGVGLLAIAYYLFGG